MNVLNSKFIRLTLPVLVLSGLLALIFIASYGSKGAPKSPMDDGETSSTSISQAGSLSDLEETSTWDSNQSEAGVSEEIAVQDGLVVGALEESRLLLLDRPYVEEASVRKQDELKIAVVSPVVGAPSQVVVSGNDVYLTATNHPDLVWLTENWASPKTLSIPRELGLSNQRIDYGALWKDGEKLVTSFSHRSGVALATISNWRVESSVTFTDRFAAFPASCTTQNSVGVLSTGKFDVLDKGTLERRASLNLSGAYVGLACGPSTFWISDITEPVIAAVSESAEIEYSLRWEGKGSSYLAYNALENMLFGTDQGGGMVFHCAIKTERCWTSQKVGNKPTDLHLVGNRIYVTVEGSQHLALLSAQDLSIVGYLRMPFAPRVISGWPK